MPSGVNAMPRGWVPTAIVLTTEGVAAARSMTDTLPVEWFAVHNVRPSRLITSENGSAATLIGVPSTAGDTLTSIGTTVPQPDALKQANADLAQKFQVSGFPTYVLLASDGRELGRQVGYAEGGPAAFINELDAFASR